MEPPTAVFIVMIIGALYFLFVASAKTYQLPACGGACTNNFSNKVDYTILPPAGGTINGASRWTLPAGQQGQFISSGDNQWVS